MAGSDTTTLAVAASMVVAALSLAMAFLGFKSYRATTNSKLLYVVAALIAFAAKSIFVAYNVSSHDVPHDTIELVSAGFDLFIVVMLFIPFFVPR